jgi:hypothetical protein
MKSHAPLRFDPDALRDRAGDRTFARGAAYHRDGQVAILALEATRVVAVVSGGEDYRTVVTGRGLRFGGECSCRAFEDSGFCKHIVAAALAANAAAPGEASPLARIRDHLLSRGPDALVALILDLAERDPALFLKLDVAATAASPGDGAALEARLRKAVDGATRTHGFVDYGEVGGWADGVDAALDALEAIASGPHAATALRLAERALARVDAALGHIDDSNGEGSRLLQRARNIHLAACRAARPDPVALARDLFARETGEAYETFDAAADRYADVLGPAGRAEYRRLAAAAWDKLPPLGPQSRAVDGDYFRLAGILDRFAETDGDLAARIALRAKDLSTPWNYYRLADFCRAQGRDDEALARAEEGLWVFADERPDAGLLRIAVELLVGAGRKPEAETHLWHAFEKAPNLEIYDTLRALAGDPACDRAIATLEARLLAARPDRWNSPADLLVRVLIGERRFDRAWTLARERGVSPGVAEALAEASEASHPREALAVYDARVRALVTTGGGPNYAGAVALIARMAPLHDGAEHAAYVAELKAAFARKRNFMKLLA